MDSNKTAKLVMIGVDAAEFSFIKTHLAELPNFTSAFGKGVTRRLKSTSALLNGSVWPTFYTASFPQDHGIYHHLQWDPALMRLRRVTADWLPAEPFYAKLERRGLVVTALDVPVSLRRYLDAGIEVTNFVCHDSLAEVESNRRGLARDIVNRFGTHPMRCEIPVDKSARELHRIRDDLVAGARVKGEVSRWLLGARRSDFFITVFGECHRAGHILWPDGLCSQAAPPPAAVFFFQAEDGIRDSSVTGVQTCALPICRLLLLLVEVTVLDPVFAHQAVGAGRVGQRHRPSAGAHAAVRELRVRRCDAGLLRHGVAQLQDRKSVV